MKCLYYNTVLCNLYNKDRTIHNFGTLKKNFTHSPVKEAKHYQFLTIILIVSVNKWM